MKKKSINKKLVLNKEIIVDLNQNQMNGVRGGFSQEYTDCFDASCNNYCINDPIHTGTCEIKP